MRCARVRCFGAGRVLALAACLAAVLVASAIAQEEPAALPPLALPDEPIELDTAEAGRIRVTVTKGLEHPWTLAFLPGGDILITERPGRFRLVRDGVLDPTPIAGAPDVYNADLGGLMDVALHPRFDENRLVYFSYTKLLDDGRYTPALGRGRLEGASLLDIEDLFVAETRVEGPAAGSALVFGPDDYLYMTVGGANDEVAQRLDSHQGKIVRLSDDGSAAPGNPFLDTDGALPEIFSYGHRNMIGLTVHPETGAIWESENGPQGGDEINILEAGANYGWPIVSYGREYEGPRVSTQTSGPGFEDAVVIWVPSIAVSGLTFYSGDRFPTWQRNLFVGGLQFGRIAGTGQLHRIVFNDDWDEIRREALLVGLRQRIRNVRQGPDGLLYLLTDEDDGALLQLEPAQ